MPESATYLVDINANPILILVRGQAGYTNCAPFGEILEQIINGEKAAPVIDFEACTGVDSTFLGILAGAAMKFQTRKQPEKITLFNLSVRNRDLIRNLGIERFLTLREGSVLVGPPPPSPKEISSDAPVNRQQMLEAHQNLINANGENLSKFQDVVEFLKNQTP